MNTYLLAFLCMAVMLVLNLLRCRKYELSAPKAVILSFVIGIMGMIGTYIMFFIENGNWGGQSFFGAVLFFPILLWPVSVVAHMKLSQLLDYATPPGMAMLVLFKLNCYLVGCCSGIVLYHSEEGIPYFFPSQIVEMLVAFLLVAILIYLEKRSVFRGKIYPVCIIAYGTIRFVLNFFRWNQNDFLFGMPAGNLWSIVSVVLGVLLLLFMRKNNKCIT